MIILITWIINTTHQLEDSEHRCKKEETVKDNSNNTTTKRKPGERKERWVVGGWGEGRSVDAP